ncbi:MAG TPA: phage tail tape measure protein [Intrasporangium sp.]|uniref:phage tail tape measure protein n=1 Tax=Intrasporangium sp. TaxID=1925024 RepID=UPI002D777A5A|nr:phage tail tape measure protein [Intrasporangium sp.]HET7398999.1 phage tail tape measure protein [Intrasporangium sp.]
MADRSIVVRLRADVAGFRAGMASAKKSVDDLTKADVKKPAKAFQDMANGAALAGAGVALGVAKAIKSFADFDAEMSAAGAATGATGQQLSDLRDAAMKAGADTKFSATEAAQGITEMAKAGVSAHDILAGGLNGALNLAAAGQLEVGRASEIAATAINQFNLQGSDVAHVADLYAAAAGNAQGSVDDIANAMKYAGVTANSMGVSIEETTGVIGLFASKGIIGEQAGTSFRSMLMSLTSPSKAAAKTMGELGINVYDASGNFVGLQGAAQILQDRLGPLDEATRNAALGQIFGNESMGAAIALYQGGGRAVADWTAKVNDAGFAQEQAAKLMDNLKGDFEQLSGSLETVFIKSGSGANDALRGLVQGLTGLVNQLGQVPGPVLLAGAALAGLALGVPKGVGMWREYRASLDALGLSMDKISAKSPRTASAIQGLGRASAGLAIGVAAMKAFGSEADSINADTLAQDLAGASSSLDAFNAAARASTSNGWGRLASDVDSFGDALHYTFDSGFLDNVDRGIGSLKGMVGMQDVSNIANASRQLDALDRALAAMVAGGNTDGAKRSFDELATAAARQGITVDQLKSKLPQYASAVATAATTAKGSAPGIDAYQQELEQTQQSAEDAKKALDNLKTAILGLGSPVVEQRNAEDAYRAAVDAATAAVKDNGRTLDNHTEKGRANRAALNGIRDSSLSAASATFTLTGDQNLAAQAVARGRVEFIRQAQQMGLTKQQAEALATSYGLIPNDVTTLIKTAGVPTAQAQIDATTGKVTILDNKTATPTVRANIDYGSFNFAESRLNSTARDRWSTIHVRTLIDTMPGAALPGARIPGNPFFIRRAAGGPIHGVGSETSDSNLLLASRNEHVWSAAEVRGAGGHDAVERMRAAAREGRLVRRANGGAVGVMRVAERVAMARSAGAAVAVLSGEDRALLRSVAALADRPVQVQAALHVDGRQAGTLVAAGDAANARGGRRR